MSAPRTITRTTEMVARDGVTLATDVHLPDGRGRWPVLLMRTPYGRAGMAARYGAASLAGRGLAVVVQDVRGTSASQGRYLGLAGDGEDGHDCVEWVAGQPWCTGRVGMFGPSAMGATQWSAAQHAPAHLVAIAPEVISMDESARWAFRLETQLMFALGMARGTLVRERDRWAPDRYGERLAGLEGALADPREALGRLPVTDQPLLEELVDVYARRAAEGPALEVGEIDYGAIEVPAYIVAGWFDFTLSGCLNQYRGMRERAGTAAAREGSRLLVGPYYHGMHGEDPSDRPAGFRDVAFGSTTRTEQARPRWLAWMARHLDLDPAGFADPDVGDGTGARVRIFTMAAGRWQDLEDFPVPDAVDERWELSSGGAANGWGGDGVLRAGPPEDDGPDRFDYDPLDPVPTPGQARGGVFDVRPLLGREDVLVYRSEALGEGIEVTGPVSVTLSVATSAPDTDFTAALLDIEPGGAAVSLADNLLRLRYRDGPVAQDVEPGRVYQITIELGAVSIHFGAGHRVGLAVSSSNFPLWDRNPNTGAPMHSDARTAIARQTIFHDGDRPSYLTLPVRGRA